MTGLEIAIIVYSIGAAAVQIGTGVSLIFGALRGKPATPAANG